MSGARRRRRAPLLGCLIWLLWACGGVAAAAQIGDRLVLAINNATYTQRQVEVYISIKESLRKTADGAVRLIDARNWGEALAAFTEDMIVLQEAQRLGSFLAPDVALDKYSAVVREKVARGAALRAEFARLGIDGPTEAHALDSVLRVAAIRRGKDRQEAQAGVGRAAARRGSAKWLSDLVDRSMVRHFAGAGDYVVIRPAGKGAPGGG